MPNEPRLIRSLCLVPPGGEDVYEEQAARKALDAGVDAIWFELEDYVPPSKKGPVRKTVGDLVRRLGGEGHTVMFRVHHVRESASEVAEDLSVILCQEAHCILTPETEPGDITRVSELLTQFEHDKGMPVGHTLIFPLLESALGIERAYGIARESPRVAYMGWCVSRDGDPATSIGFRWTPGCQETLYMRSRTLLAARAAGVRFPIGGGWYLPDDLEGLERFAIENRNLGYLGMACLSADPRFLAVVHKVFTPGEDEIARWQAIVAAEAEANSRGTMLRPSRARHAQAQLELLRHMKGAR